MNTKTRRKLQEISKDSNMQESQFDKLIKESSAPTRAQVINFTPSHQIAPVAPSLPAQSDVLTLEPMNNPQLNKEINKTEQEPEMIANVKNIPQQSAAINAVEAPKVKKPRKPRAKKVAVAPAAIIASPEPVNTAPASPEMGLMDLLINASKGGLDVYVNAATMAMKPVMFVLRNLFTLLVGLSHLGMPLMMTYFITKLPFVASIMSETTYSIMNFGYMASFYVACAFLWVSSWMTVASIGRSFKGYIHKLAELGQRA